MPPKPQKPLNLERLKELEKQGYQLIGNVLDESWTSLKTMGLFLFAKKTTQGYAYYSCKDSFLRETTPLPFNEEGEILSDRTFKKIEAMECIFILIHTKPSLKSPKEKLILVLKDTRTSGHPFLAGPYYDQTTPNRCSPEAKCIVAGEMFFEENECGDTELYANIKSGCFQNDLKTAEEYIDRVFKRKIPVKPDTTEEEVKFTYEQESPRYRARRASSSGDSLPSPLSMPRTIDASSSLPSTPLFANRSLSAPNALSVPSPVRMAETSSEPLTSPGILPRKLLSTPETLTRSLAILVHASQPTSSVRSKSFLELRMKGELKNQLENSKPRKPQPLTLRTSFFSPNPLLNFIEKPSQNCTNSEIIKGIQSLFAICQKYPGVISRLIKKIPRPASDLLEDLNQKLIQYKQITKNKTDSVLESLDDCSITHIPTFRGTSF